MYTFSQGKVADYKVRDIADFPKLKLCMLKLCVFTIACSVLCFIFRIFHTPALSFVHALLRHPSVFHILAEQ